MTSVFLRDLFHLIYNSHSLFLSCDVQNPSKRAHVLAQMVRVIFKESRHSHFITIPPPPFFFGIKIKILSLGLINLRYKGRPIKLLCHGEKKRVLIALQFTPQYIYMCVCVLKQSSFTFGCKGVLC